MCLTVSLCQHLGNSWPVRDNMKEVNVDLGLVSHNDLNQLPVDRCIVRGLLQDSLEDGGDVILHYRECAVPRII